MAFTWLTKKISRELSDRLIAPFASEGRTLEVGAFGEPSYGRWFPNRVGIDIKPGPGVDTVASVYDIPFPDASFDNVLCMSVLEHLEDPPRAIAEMRRVLKEGGRIIVSTPFLFPLHDAPGDYWRFTAYGLRHLFVAWDIETVKGESSAQESLAVLLQRYAYQTTMRANAVMKVLVLLFARMVYAMPSIPRKVFGDIHKRQEAPDAFASAFFLVARKR